MIGRTLLFYKLIEKLGSGEKSDMFRAIDLKHDRDTMFVGLKVFHHPTISKNAKHAFQKILETIKNHRPSGILPYFTMDVTEEGTHFLAMPFTEAVSLNHHVSNGKMTVKAAIAIAIRAAQGLANLHHLGIFHHNLKPSNVLITHKGEILLTDAGMNLLYGMPSPQANGNASTTGIYLSPEQLSGKPADHRSDFWSLGAIIYQAITGRAPFSHSAGNDTFQSVLTQNPQPLSNLRSNPEVLQRFFQRTLAKKPVDRYPSIQLLFEDLVTLTAIDEANEQLIDTLNIETVELPAAEWRRESVASAPVETIRDYTPPKPPENRLSIVALPFEDEHPAPEHQHFRNGFLIDLFGELTRRRAVWVMPMAAVLPFQNNTLTAREIGATLGVNMVLHGKLSRLDDHCNIYACAIAAESGTPVWEKYYQVLSDELLIVQETLAATIVNDLLEETGISAAAKHNPSAEKKPVAKPSESQPAAPAAKNGHANGVAHTTESQPEKPVQPKPAIAKPAAAKAQPRQTSPQPAHAAATHHPAEKTPRHSARQPSPAAQTAATEDSTAMVQHYYQQAVSHLENCTIDDLRISKSAFKKVLDLAPEFAPAIAGISKIYNILGLYGAYAPNTVMPRALQFAYRALEKQPTLSEGLICLGNVLAVYEWDWKNARLCFEQGLRQHPDDANAWHWYALNLLSPMGENEAALQALHRAAQLQPDAALIKTAIARQYLLNRQPEKAIARANILLAEQPDYSWINFILGQAHAMLGEWSAAMPHFQAGLKHHNQNSTALAIFANAAAQVGRRDLAMKVLRQLRNSVSRQYVSSYDIAVICVGLDDHKLALKWLDNAVKERACSLIHLAADPLMEPLRTDAAFSALLQQMNLPIYSTEAINQ